MTKVLLPHCGNSLVKVCLELPSYSGAMPAPNSLLILDSFHLDDLAIHPRDKQSCPVSLSELTGHFNFLELNGKNPGSTPQPVSLGKGPVTHSVRPSYHASLHMGSPRPGELSKPGPQLPLPGCREVIQRVQVEILRQVAWNCVKGIQKATGGERTVNTRVEGSLSISRIREGKGSRQR